MLADKAKQTSVNGLNQLFKIAKDSKGRTKIIVNKTINEKTLGEKILSCVNVRDYVDIIFKGLDKDDRKKDGEELKSFTERIEDYCYHYTNDIAYKPSIGSKCKNCEFKNSELTREQGLKSGFEECWEEAVPGKFNMSENHIFELWNFRKCEELIKSNIYYLKDIPASYFIKDTPTTQRQELQIEKTCKCDKQEEYIHSGLFTEMEKWKFPLHFIDFETTMVAIPFHRNKKPYEQIAFQFSSHTLYHDGHVVHDEFLSMEPGRFPNFDFITALKSILDRDEGTIFRYAMHENTVLRQIQEQLLIEKVDQVLPGKYKYDELIEWIDTVTQKKLRKTLVCGKRNMVDLLEVVKKYYYHPRMKGSNSIKYVIPSVMTESAFLKDKYSKPLDFGTNLKGKILWEYDEKAGIPKSPYKLLPSVFEDIDTDGTDLFMDSGEIREGGAALTAYARMQFEEMSDVERNAIGSALLKYCELDTLAMVMIYEHWRDIGNRRAKNIKGK